MFRVAERDLVIMTLFVYQHVSYLRDEVQVVIVSLVNGKERFRDLNGMEVEEALVVEEVVNVVGDERESNDGGGANIFFSSGVVYRRGGSVEDVVV